MDEETLKKIAEEKVRERIVLSPQAYLQSFEQKYVRIGDRGKAGQAKLVKLWVARFVDDSKFKGSWVEIVLDNDGNVRRINQSR